MIICLILSFIIKSKNSKKEENKTQEQKVVDKISDDYIMIFHEKYNDEILLT